MHRFFVPPGALHGSQIEIPSEIAKQASRVLRMKPGDSVTLFDGTGKECVVRIDSLQLESAVGTVVAENAATVEPQHKVTVCLALLNKPDKYEWAMQKCTELGAYAFLPVAAARSVSGSPEKARRERWTRILVEAAEQSGRLVVPELLEALPLAKALEQEGKALQSDRQRLALMPALGAELSIGSVLHEQSPQSISLFVGPEGGFTPEEVAQAQSHGVIPVSLGPRTLRAETAAVAALTIILYELGEMEARQDRG